MTSEMGNLGESRESLTLYLKHIDALLADVTHYLRITQDYLRASNEEEYDIMVKLVETLQTARQLTEDLITTKDFPEKLSAMFDNYIILRELFPFLFASTGAISTSSTITQAKELLTKIRSQIEIIRAHRSRHDPELVRQVKLDTQKVATYYQDIINRPPSSQTNRLVLNMIQFCLDRVSPAQRARLLQIIEQEKDVSLGVKVKHVQCDYPATMSFLSKCGLYSATEPMNPFALFEFLGYRYSNKKSLVDNLATLDANVAIINNQIGTPLCFQMESLTNDEFIAENKLSVSATAGVTGTTIKKMRTITDHGSRAQNAVVTPPTLYEKSKGLPWLVLDTLDGDHYRVMRTASGIMQEARAIAPILLGCDMRPIKYQELMGEQIASAYRPDLSILRDVYSKRPTLKFNADLVKQKSIAVQLEFFTTQFEQSAELSVHGGASRRPTHLTSHNTKNTKKKTSADSAARTKGTTADSTTTKQIVRQRSPTEIAARMIKITGRIMKLPRVYEIIMENIDELYQTPESKDEEDDLGRLVQYDIMARLFYQEFDREYDARWPGLHKALVDILQASSKDNVVVITAVIVKKTSHVLADTLRSVLGVVSDRLDKSHMWTEYGVSLKSFIVGT